VAELTAWPRRLLRFTLLCALIALVAWRTDYALIARYFHVNLLWASLAVQPLIACGFVFGGERLRSLVGEPRIGLFPAIKAVILGGGMNVFLPGRLSEFLKAAYLRDNCSIPFSTGLAAIFIEKVIDLAILGCVAAISASLYLDRTNTTFLPAMVLAVGILLGLPWLERRVLRLCALLPWRALRAFSERFVTHAAARVRGGAFYKALGYGVTIWLISIAGFALFLYCTDSVRIGVVGAMVVFVMATIGGAVPALPVCF
jgi:lysylphosphatidylglycerol synthase-like protein